MVSIPTRKRGSVGNRAYATRLADSVGERQLSLLKESMRPSDLEVGRKVSTLPDGSIITTSVNYGISEITVDCSSVVSGGESSYCFCSRCFSNAYIIRRRESQVKTYGKTQYDITICNGEDLYIPIINRRVVSFGFDEYAEGQQVVVGIGGAYDFTTECCEILSKHHMCNVMGVVDDANGFLVLYPIVTGMEEWAYIDG